MSATSVCIAIMIVWVMMIFAGTAAVHDHVAADNSRLPTFRFMSLEVPDTRQSPVSVMYFIFVNNFTFTNVKSYSV